MNGHGLGGLPVFFVKLSLFTTLTDFSKICKSVIPLSFKTLGLLGNPQDHYYSPS